MLTQDEILAQQGRMDELFESLKKHQAGDNISAMVNIMASIMLDSYEFAKKAQGK